MITKVYSETVYDVVIPFEGVALKFTVKIGESEGKVYPISCHGERWNNDYTNLTNSQRKRLKLAAVTIALNQHGTR